MKLKTKIVLYLTVVSFAAAITAGLFYYWIAKPSQIVLDAGEKIANSMTEAFEFVPRIQVNNQIVFEEHAAILEVALISQRVIHDYEYSDSWLGSTKQLQLRGVYLAKYGFDLKTQDFTIQIDKDSLAGSDSYLITFIIPEPQLLSLETENYRVLVDEEGWWNKFSKKEREMAVNALRRGARSKAASLKIRNRIKQSLETQIEAMLAELALPIPVPEVRFVWQTTLPVKNDSPEPFPSGGK